MGEEDDTVHEAQDFMTHITPKNSYGAVYLPWIKMLDPTGQSAEPIPVPPSGFVAGLYARTDARRRRMESAGGHRRRVGAALWGWR